MTEEKQNSEEPVQPPAMGGMLLTMLFMIYIIMNPELRDGMGNLAGSILGSKISFDHQYPTITFLLAGITMISLTTVIRHVLIDWESMAEVQSKMAAYNKELSEARRSGNEARMTRSKILKTASQLLQLQIRLKNSGRLLSAPKRSLKPKSTADP